MTSSIRMPRQPRYRIPGLPQHVVQRGNDRQPTFYRPPDYFTYKHYLREAAVTSGCRIHAYVLMTNHIHLLVTPAGEDSIPGLMQALGRRYVRYVNKAYGRTGTLWEGRYKACLIQTDSYLLACQRYVELNPVRGGLVTEPGQYAHSSYRHNALGQGDPLVTEHDTYTALGNSPAECRRAYRRLFAADAEPEPTAYIREVTNGCLVLGNDCFKDQIEIVLARSVRPGRAGRPRKIAV